MADVKISELPSATPLAGDEAVPIVQGGITSQTTVQDIANLTAGLLGGEQEIAAAAGDNNNVAVTVATVNRVLVDTTAGSANFTGITAGANGQLLVVTNEGASDLTLANESASSSANNRFYGVTDITLPVGGSQLLSYSGTLTRWVMV